MANALLIIPLWLGALMLWSLGIHIIAQKKHIEFRAFAFTVIAAGIYCGGYAGELSSGSIAEMTRWSQLQYVGVSTMAYFWIHFVLHYTGRQELMRPFLRSVVALFPIATIIIKLFDGNLHLIYANAVIDPRFNTFSITPGPWYYVSIAYTYACGLAGIIILASFGRKRLDLHRKNAFLFLVITILPILSDVIYLSKGSPFGNLDITPYALLIVVSLLYFAVLKNDLVNVAPIARDFIFENLPLCVLTFDNSRKLCEANESARAVLALGPDCIGMNASEVFSEFYLDRMLPESGRTGFEMPLNGRDFDVQTYILRRKEKKRVGWVVTMVDISDRKRTEMRMMQMLTRQNTAPTKSSETKSN
jgi:PAS domain-containing protein